MEGVSTNQVWINLAKFFMVIIIIFQQKFGHEYVFHYRNACTPSPSPPPSLAPPQFIIIPTIPLFVQLFCFVLFVPH
jgi:hypothetical protein